VKDRNMPMRDRLPIGYEQRSWLKDRDTFGAAYAIQSCSLFPSASRLEGGAIITEKRAAELAQRLKQKKED
jgi:uncharacterized protein YecT (DUF1311 family)